MPDRAGDGQLLVRGLLAWRVLRHINRDEHDAAHTCLTMLVTIGGANGLYQACIAWADLVAGHAVGDDDDDFLGLEIRQSDTGEQVDAGDLPAHMQGPLWAGRFITATHNVDQPTMQALFGTQVLGPDLDGILALTGMAAAVMAAGEKS